MTSYELQRIRGLTSFEPLCPGGANFCAHRLDFSEWGRVRVVSTWKAKLAASVFVDVAIAIVAVAIFVERARVLCLIYGSVFLAIGLFLTWALVLRKRAFFNLTAEQFVSGKEVVDFSRIAALQVVVEVVTGGKGGSYLSRELNLVLDDGSRVNVMDHGNRVHFEEDTQKLAETLGLEVWDKDGLWAPGKEQDVPPFYTNPRTMIFMGLAFCAFPLAILTFILFIPLVRTAMSADWVECPATVDVSTLETSRSSKGGTTYRIKLNATYSYEGRFYTCTKYDFFHTSFYTNVGVKGMREAVASLPIGTQTTCLVNPKKPEESVMRRKMPSAAELFPVAFLSVFLVVGAILTGLGFRSLRIVRQLQR